MEYTPLKQQVFAEVTYYCMGGKTCFFYESTHNHTPSIILGSNLFETCFSKISFVVKFNNSTLKWCKRDVT